MYTLSQYLMTLSDPDGLTRTLGAVEVCRDPKGRMCFSVGNSAAVFRIRHEGRIRSLRCYLRPQRHLKEIYGERLLERELYLYTSPESGVWVDAVIGEWIEGEDLHTAIARAAEADDRTRLGELAGAFDRLAAAMVADDRAHGDLKPENILVDRSGALHVIDLDASFLPGMAGETSPELGTAAYQHPARTAADFNERMDDYPAALISTALHALRVDPTLWRRYGSADALLYNPRRAATDPALNETLDQFEARGMALAYRIARLLRAPRPELPELPALLAEAARRSEAPQEGPQAAGAPSAAEWPELFAEGGRWGFRTAERVVIPPLYDNGFDFTEGLAAVLLGHTWHFIDPQGHTRLSCSGCEAVKPFRGGYARILRHGRWRKVDPQGREFEI